MIKFDLAFSNLNDRYINSLILCGIDITKQKLDVQCKHLLLQSVTLSFRNRRSVA